MDSDFAMEKFGGNRLDIKDFRILSPETLVVLASTGVYRVDSKGKVVQRENLEADFSRGFLRPLAADRVVGVFSAETEKSALVFLGASGRIETPLTGLGPCSTSMPLMIR